MPQFNPDDYVPVQERIGQFWKAYPDGRILTFLESPEDDFERCRYRAEVYKDDQDARPAATGWAFELAGSGMANKTSHEENCETSAIGRALANLGFATTHHDRPSREEMTKVAATDRHRMASPNGDSRTPRPWDSGGTYNAIPENAQTSPPGGPLPATEPQIKAIFAIGRGAARMEDEDIHAFAKEKYGVTDMNELTRKQASELIDALKAQQPARVR